MFLTSKPLEIARLRIESGYSIRKLGEESGVNPSTIFKMECCNQRVRPRTAKAVSDALKVSVYDLFTMQPKEVNPHE